MKNKALVLALCLLIVIGIVFWFGQKDKQESLVPAVALEQTMACANEKSILIEGTGDYSRPVSSSAQAQAFFDQGLRLTYGYYFPEALASFNAALCFDENNPMIHWGRALAIAPNPNSRYGAAPDDPDGLGLEAIKQAQSLIQENNNNEIERGLINTLAVLFDTDTHPDQVARSAAFIDATQKLYAQFPNDLEVAFLAADAIMMATPWQYFSQLDGSPINMAEKAQAALEKGMVQNPNHPGLTHMHIHLMENSFTPQRAEASADRLESLTPKLGHMVHMPGHIFMRVGRFEDAISTNERSLQADDYFLEQWGDLPLPSGTTYGLSARVHAPHARNFIHWGATLQGNSELALSSAKQMADGIEQSRIDRGGPQRTIAMYWMTLRFFSRWDEILALDTDVSLPPYLTGMLHFVRGSAFAAQNNIEGAQAELTRLNEVMEDESLSEIRTSINTASDLLVIAQQLLAGDIEMEKQNFDQAIEHYKMAVEKQDSLRYMEPPDWLQSTRLSLGQAYLNTEMYNEAEQIYRKDLDLLQENGWALYGLLQTVQAQEQEENIQTVSERFGKAWQYADVDLGSL